MKAFKAIVVALTVATLIQIAAVAFMLGYEVGRDSQSGTMLELYMKAYPGESCYLIDFNPHRHPLWSTLYQTLLLLLTCWLVAAFYAICAKKNKLQTIAKTERTPQAKNPSL